MNWKADNGTYTYRAMIVILLIITLLALLSAWACLQLLA